MELKIVSQDQAVIVFLVITNVAGIFLLRHYDAFYKIVPVKNFELLGCNNGANHQDVSSLSPQEIMKKVMNGVVNGKNCNDMSELFLKQLQLQGYKARKLFVVKSVGDPYATHTLVEVFEKTNGLFMAQYLM